MRKMLLPVLTGFWLSGAAQQSQQSLLSAGGGHAVTESLHIDWALGEAVIETVASTTSQYTQGFLQPVLFKRSAGSPLIATGLQLSAYPNPVEGRLTLSFSTLTNEPLQLLVYNVLGKAIRQVQIPVGSRQFTVNTTGLAQGSYLLSVSNSGGTFYNNFNLIKLH